MTAVYGHLQYSRHVQCVVTLRLSRRLVQRRNNEKYLGFGAWDARSGRRAALQAAANDASPLDSATDENEERDAWLRKVQARDLIDFGMIPVSADASSTALQGEGNRNGIKYSKKSM